MSTSVEEEAAAAPPVPAVVAAKREREAQDTPDQEAAAEDNDSKRAKSEEEDPNAVKVVLIDVPASVAKRMEDAGMEALEKSSGATISLRDNPLGTAKQVCVKGTAQAISNAKETIMTLMISGSGDDLSAATANADEKAAENQSVPPPKAKELTSEIFQKDVERVIQCPPQYVGRIIGKGGQTIRDLQASSGASVSIQQEHIPEGVPRPIHIRGKSASVEKACEEIEKLIDTSQYGGIDAKTVEQVKTVLIPPHRIGKIIGRGGENIMRFQKESGAHVQLNQHIPKPVITLSGTKECVAKGEQLVNEFLERMALELGDTPGPSQYGPSTQRFEPRGRGGRGMQDNRMHYQSYKGGYHDPSAQYNNSGDHYPHYGGRNQDQMNYPRGGRGSGYRHQQRYNDYSNNNNNNNNAMGYSSYNASKFQSDYGRQAVGGGAPPPPNMQAGHSNPWQIFHTAEGAVYYYNSITGESTWDPPHQ